MSGGKEDGRLSDQQLRELGVVFFSPPVQPVRKTVVIDGRKCRVFRSEAERTKHIAACRVQVTSNCIHGARGPCVIKAMDACRGPSWQRFLPFWPGRKDPRAVEECEAEAMEACVASAEQDCGRYATQLCENSHPSRLWID